MHSTTRQRRDRHRDLRCAVAALLCVAALALGAPALASPLAAPPVVRMAQAENGISLEQATRMVREQTGGQVLRAETRRDKGRTVHRIRVLTEDGLVRTWRVDAETGRIY
jgi:uncharacterized membrane protein YkoI